MGQSNFENLLAAVTDAILEDEQDIDQIIGRYAVPRGDVENFIRLIRRLHIPFVGVRQ